MVVQKRLLSKVGVLVPGDVRRLSKLALQGGESVLKRLAHEPPLPIGNRIEGLDGLRSRARIELHRPAGAMDARRPSRRLESRLRLAAREAGGLGDLAHEPGWDRMQLRDRLRREAGNVERFVVAEDGGAFLGHAASPIAAPGFRVEMTSAAKARALDNAVATLPT